MPPMVVVVAVGCGEGGSKSYQSVKWSSVEAAEVARWQLMEVLKPQGLELLT